MAQALERAGIDNPELNVLLQPPNRYLDQAQDGVIRLAHPRILLPELASWDGVGISPLMAERLALYRSLGERPEQYPRLWS